MGLIVQKFGGSSVRDRERLLRAMRIVRRTWEQGDDVVVVLSAQGDTTDALLARAREGAYSVRAIKKSERRKYPAAPFTTSNLQGLPKANELSPST